MTDPRLLAVFVFVSLCTAGCGEAARDNPLDPQSESFRDEGGIAGQITETYPSDDGPGTFDGYPNVAVRLVPVGPAGRPELATRTDGEGFFALSDVPSGPYAVVVEETGFRVASDTVTVEVGRVAEAVLRLDALPIIREKSLRSVHIIRWFPEDPVFQLEVEVQAEDPDPPDVVAAAALAVPDAGGATFQTFAISPVPGQPGLFRETFDDSEFPGGIAGLLGRGLRIQVEDASQGTTLSEPVGLVRVIQLSPQTLAPQGDTDITDPTPTLVWSPADLAFDFTYRVELYVRDGGGGSTLIEHEEGIDPSQTSYTVEQSLEPGAYWWAIWVVDTAGNRSRSRQAGFNVR